MKGQSTVTMLLIAAAFAAGSFVATQAWQPVADAPEPRGAPCGPVACGKKACCESLVDWLQVSPESAVRLVEIAAPFGEARAKLESVLYTERGKLADLFDSDVATDEEILQQVERVIEADNALERRVVEQLVALRKHLTGDQRARLFKRCAQGVREAGGCRWRHGGSDAAGGCGKVGKRRPDVGESDRPQGRSEERGDG